MLSTHCHHHQREHVDIICRPHEDNIYTFLSGNEGERVIFLLVVERLELVYCLESGLKDTRSDASNSTINLKRDTDFTGLHCNAVCLTHGKPSE